MVRHGKPTGAKCEPFFGRGERVCADYTAEIICNQLKCIETELLMWYNTFDRHICGRQALTSVIFVPSHMCLLI